MRTFRRRCAICITRLGRRTRSWSRRRSRYRTRGRLRTSRDTLGRLRRIRRTSWDIFRFRARQAWCRGGDPGAKNPEKRWGQLGTSAPSAWSVCLFSGLVDGVAAGSNVGDGAGFSGWAQRQERRVLGPHLIWAGPFIGRPTVLRRARLGDGLLGVTDQLSASAGAAFPRARS